MYNIEHIIIVPVVIVLIFSKRYIYICIAVITTFNGENAKVTNAFAPKFTSTAMLSPLPLSLNGKTSEIISQPMGPKDTCMNKIAFLIFLISRDNQPQLGKTQTSRCQTSTRENRKYYSAKEKRRKGIV